MLRLTVRSSSGSLETTTDCSPLSRVWFCSKRSAFSTKRFGLDTYELLTTGWMSSRYPEYMIIGILSFAPVVAGQHESLSRPLMQSPHCFTTLALGVC